MQNDNDKNISNLNNLGHNVVPYTVIYTESTIINYIFGEFCGTNSTFDEHCHNCVSLKYFHTSATKK